MSENEPTSFESCTLADSSKVVGSGLKHIESCTLADSSICFCLDDSNVYNSFKFFYTKVQY